jgi:hypothetical protein
VRVTVYYIGLYRLRYETASNRPSREDDHATSLDNA